MSFRNRVEYMARLEIEVHLVYIGFQTNLETCRCCEEVIYSKTYKQAVRCKEILKFTGVDLCESCFEILKTI